MQNEILTLYHSFQHKVSQPSERPLDQRQLLTDVATELEVELDIRESETASQ